MGSTVTTGKLAAAFARENGTIIYVLFEKTYEKNCYPHTPNWCCIAIGEYADVMKWVFMSAAVCEGGMLQNTHGYIKPENYIEGWRRELAKPVRMTDVSIRLHVGTGLYDPIPVGRVDKVQAVLIKIGKAEVFDAMTASEIRLSLHDDINIILALYGYKEGFMQPWRILDHGDTTTVPEPGLAPPSSHEHIRPPVASVYRIDANNRLVRYDSEPWHCGGWAYSTVADFINDVAYAQEMLQTGSAKRLISEFRVICDAAKPVPSATLITVTRDAHEAERWHLESANELAAKLGFTPQASMFTFTFAKAVAAEATYELMGLHNNQMAWDVPCEETDSRQAQEAGASCMETQAALF